MEAAAALAGGSVSRYERRALRATARSGRHATLLGWRPRRSSLDHLIGTGEDRRRDHEAERFGGLQIDD
jgi:hypothetical protein